MTMSNAQLFRFVLLVVCVALWAAALPTMTRGIVGHAFTNDMVSAGSLFVALAFHTLSVMLFGCVFDRPGRSWL
jgi:hypothetical protein